MEFVAGKVYIARVTETGRKDGSVLVNRRSDNKLRFILRDGTVMVADIAFGRDDIEYVSFYTRTGRKERRVYASEIDN